MRGGEKSINTHGDIFINRLKKKIVNNFFNSTLCGSYLAKYILRRSFLSQHLLRFNDVRKSVAELIFNFATQNSFGIHKRGRGVWLIDLVKQEKVKTKRYRSEIKIMEEINTQWNA